MFRKYISLFIILLMFILGYSNSAPKRKSYRSPNIVVILADDQGWGDLSVTGNKNISTPHIASIAKNGATFTHFYVSPVCSPTRAELLTGRYSARSNVYSTTHGGGRIDLDETTIAKIFKKAGYATGMVGKWHNGTQPPYNPIARGFDYYYGYTAGHWGSKFFPMLTHNGKIGRGTGYLANDLTRKAMGFIEKHQEEPFLLYVAYGIPHTPLQVPHRWWKQFKDKELVMMNQRHPKKENPKFTKAVLAMTANVDWNVGRIKYKLEKLDLLENTIIVYFSDNGPQSWRWNAGMKGKKGSVNEGGVRVPMFIQWAGHIKAEQKIPQISAAIDLLPTLADLAGINYQSIIDKPLDGISLKPLLMGNDERWPERLIYNSWGSQVSVRSPKWRLLGSGKLYNIIKDPDQYHNVAAEHPQIANVLLDSLEKWQKKVLSQLDKHSRPFTIGARGFKYTQLPARDGVGHGNIKRSNKWPNSSYFTHWTSVNDSIMWNVQVLSEGDFKAYLYYTCPISDIGSTIQLRLGESRLTAKIDEAFNPPLRGMQHDLVKRGESYVKLWKRKELGIMHLEEGTGILTLKAIDIPESQVMDFRMLVFVRVSH